MEQHSIVNHIVVPQNVSPAGDYTAVLPRAARVEDTQLNKYGLHQSASVGPCCMTSGSHDASGTRGKREVVTGFSKMYSFRLFVWWEIKTSYLTVIICPVCCSELLFVYISSLFYLQMSVESEKV